MKLFLNDTSPYARLVVVTALQTGHRDIELAWTDPWLSPPELLAVNPFSTVPTLVTDEGESLFESAAICEHLVACRDGDAGGPAPTRRHDPVALRRQATARHLMDSAFRRVILARFVPAAQDNPLARRAEAALARALPSLETEPFAGLDFGLAVALDYIAFRLADLYAAHAGPTTRRWLAAMHERDPMQRSTPACLAAHPASIGGLTARLP